MNEPSLSLCRSRYLRPEAKHAVKDTSVAVSLVKEMVESRSVGRLKTSEFNVASPLGGVVLLT